MDYAKAIRIIRSARGLSQKELSELIGYTPAYISRIEKGTRIPSIDVLQRISDRLGIPMHLIMLLATTNSEKIPASSIEKFATDLLDLLLAPRHELNAKLKY